MRKVSRASRAILVLEAPWALDEADAHRTSVLPFIEGIAKLAGDVEVYYTTFYDKSSFHKALDHLCKCRFENAIVYLAAHGFKNKIGDVDIIQALTAIGIQSKSCNITGVLLGSCFVGGYTTAMEVCLEGTHLQWAAGYASTCSWLTGTQIDNALLASMIETDENDFKDREVIVRKLAEAIRPFNGDAVIGEDYKERSVTLRDSLRFVVQQKGSGNRARDVSDEVIEHAYDLEEA